VNPNTIDLTPIINALIAVAAAMIAPSAALLLAWLRSRKHWKILEDAQMNQVITESAQRLGAAFLTKVQKAGESVHDVDVGNPELALFANRIISGYPGFVARLGYTPDKVAAVILDEAQRLGHLSPTVPAPAPSAQGAMRLAAAAPNIQAYP
jgi:hypothetical protein